MNYNYLIEDVKESIRLCEVEIEEAIVKASNKNTYNRAWWVSQVQLEQENLLQLKKELVDYERKERYLKNSRSIRPMEKIVDIIQPIVETVEKRHSDDFSDFTNEGCN